MSFGFSVGDFVAAIEFSNKVRKEFVDAPGQFKAISDEVRSLSIALQDADVAFPKQQLKDDQKRDLEDIDEGCQNVLLDLQRLLDKNSELSSEVGSVVLHHDDQERRSILDWLTPIDYTHQHNDFINRRQEGTGQWLLDLIDYQAWLKTCGQTLFCPGIPGAGKTIITSIVVDDLQERFRGDSTIGIAYIYCNFRRQVEQKASSLFASLLRQLCQERSTLPEGVKALYTYHKADQTRPSLDEILGVLQSVVTAYLRVFIIVDTLDECQITDGCRQSLLSGLVNLQEKCRVNLLATSRPISSIEREFKGNSILEIRASEVDVRRYLEGHMFRLPGFVARSFELQEEIKTTIINAIDRIYEIYFGYLPNLANSARFLLAQLHLDSLTGKRAPKAVRTALKTLATRSDAYDRAYEDAMERINGQVKDQEGLAKQVLSWITCAKRPMTTSELQHALAVEIGESQFDKENLPDIEDAVSVYAGLVTIDQESNIIRLAHYTTHEYFIRTQSCWFPESEIDIAKICVTYLSFDAFQSGSCPADEDFEARQRDNVLYSCAAQNWGYHAYGASIPIPVIISFLESEAKLSASIQAMVATKRNSWQSGYSQEVPKSMKALHLSAYFGLEEVTATLLGRSHIPDIPDGGGWTPLSWAARRGHVHVVQLLLETKRANIDLKDGVGMTPLHWAALYGHEAITKLLLAHGAELESKDNNSKTPLHWATSLGHEGIVELLVAHCATLRLGANTVD